MLAGLALCEMPSQDLQSAFRDFRGGPRRGQQQSATQTLRVHLLGIEIRPIPFAHDPICPVPIEGP